MELYYAIRHNSGNYLTDKYTGPSYWEGEEEKGLVRLFSKESVAKAWITNWLKGAVVKAYGPTNSTLFPGEEYIGLEYSPRPHRKRAHLSIIPVTLLFGRPLT